MPPKKVTPRSQGRKKRGGDDNRGIYNFTDPALKLFFFSDEEGGAPFPIFSTPTGSVLPVSGPKDAVLDTLDASFKFEQVGANGTSIISGIKENVAFAFLGDLTDRSPYDIRITRNMIKMKEDPANNGKVILIGGNRDFNKVRVADEFGIQTIIEGVPVPVLSRKFTGLTNIWDLCEDISKNFGEKYTFIMNGSEIKERLASMGNAGQTVKVDNEELIVMREDDIMAVVQK